jgi:hypothetical protein
MEGLIQIAKELLLATSIAELFTVFPWPLLGLCFSMAGIKLTMFAKDIRLEM